MKSFYNGGGGFDSFSYLSYFRLKMIFPVYKWSSLCINIAKGTTDPRVEFYHQSNCMHCLIHFKAPQMTFGFWMATSNVKYHSI